MLDKAKLNQPVNGEESNHTDLLWGADEIARAIGRTSRQVHHILIKRQLKSARKVGGKWVASRQALIREICGGA
jgi:hypothetical protein